MEDVSVPFKVRGELGKKDACSVDMHGVLVSVNGPKFACVKRLVVATVLEDVPVTSVNNSDLLLDIVVCSVC